MKRLLFTLLIVAVPAHAFEWPWQPNQRESYSYCKGFVFAGLGAFPVKDLSRIGLWLSWNRINGVQFESGELNGEQFDAGKARFTGLLAAQDTDALLQVANSECNFAES